MKGGDGGGKLWAFEKDKSRFNLLKQRMGLLCPTKDRLILLNQDFLTVSPGDYGQVSHILLDPSCSGSGMVKLFGSFEQVGEQVGEVGEEEEEEEEEEEGEKRIKKLADFQFNLILHAFKCTTLFGAQRRNNEWGRSCWIGKVGL